MATFTAVTNSLTDSSNDASRDSVQQIAQAIARRRMATPALLFLVSHRPLGFVAGQLLYSLQPLADLLDVSACTEFAAILSAPDGAGRLAAALTETETPSGSNTNSNGA